MTAEDGQTGEPDPRRRIKRSQPGRARRYAFRIARLACSVTGVRDHVALDIAQRGLDRPTEIAELVRLWELERELESACAAQLGADPSSSSPAQLQRHPVCVEARAVAAVIAALRPDPVMAATEATREALAAGCAWGEVKAAADELL
ncbi:hypothetical protein [Terrabacter sp. MAHUQ-38]|uniref:hypothetical protein n=1 Tax=unclassified Terrabacter TaxID=2630222 RepID=UPI00165DD4B2|nr:hypothetical protein [Terrabacter sp. MAHUQ-38]MBC9820571.1 hypothetical protein [Terrabacter sp. MAHUQ-38]